MLICQTESVPIELLILFNFILEGIDLSEKGFSKESLALVQAMMFNFSFNRHGKRRSLKKKRHDQSKETLFPVYVAIKIYSHSCSKTMINWLHFCAGISVSYNRLLDIKMRFSKSNIASVWVWQSFHSMLFKEKRFHYLSEGQYWP